MTIQGLLVLIDSLYPNAESDTNKIAFMNLAQEDLSPYFGKIVEDVTLKTVVDQDSYVYPTGLTDISEIISLAVANQATPTNRYDYLEYVLARAESNPMQYGSFHEIISSTGTKKLVLYPVPDTVNLTIAIRYRKALTALSSVDLTASPDFPSNYHSMLAYYAVSQVCAVGGSADRDQSDYYMQKYQDKLDNLWKNTNETDRKVRRKPTDNPQWHNYKSYGAGF